MGTVCTYCLPERSTPDSRQRLKEVKDEEVEEKEEEEEEEEAEEGEEKEEEQEEEEELMILERQRERTDVTRFQSRPVRRKRHW